MIPELAGNPFLPRIFEMYDTDGDGYMGAADLRALLESLTRLANEEERYHCESEPSSVGAGCWCLRVDGLPGWRAFWGSIQLNL